MKRYYKGDELVFEEKPKNSKFQDLDGQKFKKLTVLGYAGRENRQTFWYCKCDCGNVLKVFAGHLKSGHTNSCGCFNIEITKETNTKHGHKRRRGETLTYSTWCGMLARCRNQNSDRFPYYGGRGITVCERWLKFENFLEDMGERQKGTTIERINNDGNYEPGNCRWATRKEQANNKRNNHFLTFDGKTQTIAQWVGEIGFYNTDIVYARLSRGKWDIEKALTTPPKQIKK